MHNILEDIQTLKEILKKENINDEIFEIAFRFGAIKNALSFDDELVALLNEIENILRKSLMNNTFKMEDKLELFSMFGQIENHLKSNLVHKNNKLINDTTIGMTASAGAKVLMKAGPMGLLAAGVLGVANTYILQNNEEPHISNKDLLTIAYYLSRFDHEHLFGLHISSAKAIDALGNVLNVKPNTLRGKRDYFDSLLPNELRKSDRKGYNEIKSTKIYDEIIQQYDYISNEDEKKMRKAIVDILGKYQDGLIL